VFDGEAFLTVLEEKVREMKDQGLLDLYREIKSGKLELIDPSPPQDFPGYLSRLDYSLWFWSTLTLVILTLATVYASDLAGWIRILRMFLGSIMVLFIPGYTLIEALYPAEVELSDLERLALSIGLSLAVVPLVGLVLNYTPWGIRLNPVLASLTLLSIALLIIAAYRKYLLVARGQAANTTLLTNSNGGE
jgi:uncharacterized membrane protein